jgi:CRISPR-associated endonuclease/helicase Cas3
VDFSRATGFAAPNPQQQLVGSSPLEERLLILEAETGSGKTEAAFWRFARLFEAGLVNSLYFALPTRSAAVQMHSRINRMLQHLFGVNAPEAILAVPGYLKSGEAEGMALPRWQVHWDDEGSASEYKLAARWAAENTKRYLAATVAVGTVDQAMLGALRVKHAHLRSAALSRSLLVIDEVHASDRYMTEIQGHLLRMHLDRGGHAMLMPGWSAGPKSGSGPALERTCPGLTMRSSRCGLSWIEFRTSRNCCEWTRKTTSAIYAAPKPPGAR